MAEEIEEINEPSQDEVKHIFKLASSHVRGMKSLDRDQMLAFYALYKQSTEGKCNMSKPGIWDMVGRAKWDAWNKLGELASLDAMRHYVLLLAKIEPTWTDSAEGVADDKKPQGMGVAVSTMMRDEEEELKKEEKSAFDWCKEGNLKELRSYVAEHNVDVNAKDEEGMALLHWASDRGHVDIINFLVQNKANLDAQDQEKQTALHYAVVCEHTPVVQFLLKAGADATIRDADGQSPGDYAENEVLKKLLTAS